jgi:hypothetical protein
LASLRRKVLEETIKKGLPPEHSSTTRAVEVRQRGERATGRRTRDRCLAAIHHGEPSLSPPQQGPPLLDRLRSSRDQRPMGQVLRHIHSIRTRRWSSTSDPARTPGTRSRIGVPSPPAPQRISAFPPPGQRSLGSPASRLRRDLRIDFRFPVIGASVRFLTQRRDEHDHAPREYTSSAYWGRVTITSARGPHTRGMTRGSACRSASSTTTRISSSSCTPDRGIHAEMPDTSIRGHE